MDIKPRIHERYDIVFTRSKYKGFIMRFLNPDMSHVYAVKRSPGGHFWMVLNPVLTHIDIVLEAVEDYPTVRTLAGDEAVILPVYASIDLTRPRWTICIFNCVEVIKGLLGVRSFWTWTPFQLYKLLLTGGAKP